jgi:hypothetical protein
MIRRLAVLATIGLVALVPVVAIAQGYGGGGGGYGTPPVDYGYDQMLQYQMMLQMQQQARLQQKKAQRASAKQSGQAAPSSSKAATSTADSKRKKQPDNLTATKAKSRTGSPKANTTKPAPPPGDRSPAKVKSREKSAPTKAATDS